MRRARLILERFPQRWDVEAFGDRLHVAVREPADDGTAIASQLTGNGVAVTSLRRVMPSLENVFISLIKKEEKSGV